MSIVNRSTKLRMRRLLRRQQKQVEAVTTAAERQFDRNLIGRFDRFWRVKRFAGAWLGLILLITGCTVIQTLSLSGYYQTLKPAPGGIYNEGIVGTYSNANPLFATGAVDTAVSRLIFAGLLKYNDQNDLVGDLASGYSVDQSGRKYTVTLRPNLKWQDGAPLTSKDVAFTYHLIQNPDAQSPLLGSWQNITISTPDTRTIVFDLPNSFAAFPYSLLTGIVPEHVLAGVPAAELRSNSFNTTAPVGAGPFAWQGIQTSTTADPDKAVSLIALKPFANYSGGSPKLSGFVIHAYGSEGAMVDGYKHRDVNAMAGLNDVPDSLKNAADTTPVSFPSTAATMTFFKTSEGVLADSQVRQALVQGADTQAVLDKLDYTAKAVKEPFLSGQTAYDKKYEQAGFDQKAANETLDKAGWVRDGTNVRRKDTKPLSFRVYAEDTSENRKTLNTLIADWKVIGVDAIPVYQSLTDFQTTVDFHSYDALLYTISIGKDPDVFAYWDSSQADIRSTSRLNFSEYKSTTADTALEAGRTRLDPALRAIKYRPFLQAWQADNPALGLYQPRFLYITRGTVYGLNDHSLNADVDRYASVTSWQIHTARVTNN